MFNPFRRTSKKSITIVLLGGNAWGLFSDTRFARAAFDEWIDTLSDETTKEDMRQQATFLTLIVDYRIESLTRVAYKR